MTNGSDIVPRVSRRGLLKGAVALGGYAATASSLVAATLEVSGHKSDMYEDGLKRGGPENFGVDPARLLAFLDDLDAKGYELHSFMLWRRGFVVAEGWWAPYRDNLRHMAHSATKSVTVCAVGMAIAEGRFRKDDKVISFFKEHLPPVVSENLAAMTVEDLLTMRTGHASMTSGAEWRPIKTSWIAEFFKIPVVYRPGTKFVYTSAATYMLSAIVTRTTGQSAADYLKPRMFDPMGIRDYTWPVGPEGISPGANGLSWRTSDMLKLGILYAQNGVWEGRALLPETWVKAVQYPHVPGKYGYQWWLGPDGSYFADGLFEQRSVVFPHQEAVLAITAGIPTKSAFSETLFKHFPGVFSDGPIHATSLSDKLKQRSEKLSILPPLRQTSSPVETSISGLVFGFPENSAGIKAMHFDFSTPESCLYSMTDDRGTHHIRVGLRSPIEGATTMTGHTLHHEYEPGEMRVVAQGTWMDTRTFVMTWTFNETAFRDTVICRFTGPNIRFDRSVNTNYGPTELPTVKGTLLSGPEASSMLR